MTEDDVVKDEREAPRAAKPRHRVRQLIVVVVLAVAAFVTGLAFFNYMLMPGLIHSESEVRTPDVRDLTLEQAEVMLTPLGFTLSRAGERFDSNIPSGFIISQDPRPMTPVRGSKQIRVVVSLGEEYSSVPALEGESLRSAEQLLMSAGLRPGHVSRAPSNEVGAGLIMASDPEPQSILSRDAEVNLFVSSGSYQEAFVMPDLVGREIGRSRDRLENSGFTVRVPYGTGVIGAIVFQHPSPGARLAPRDTIVLRAMGRLIQ